MNIIETKEQLRNEKKILTVEDICSSDFIFDEPNAMDNWEKYGFIKKDILDGDIFKIIKLNSVKEHKFNILLENGLCFDCNLKKEKRYFEIIDENFKNYENLKDWINSEFAYEFFKNNDIYVKIEVDKFHSEPSIYEAYLDNKKDEFLRETKISTNYYKAKVINKNNGGFIVDIDGVEAFLPGGQAAANIIRNFDDMLGKELNIMFEDYIKEGDTFIVSNKKYIQTVLPERIKSLATNKKYFGSVTGTTPFGIFIEFDEIFTGLLHTSEMRMETLNNFKSKKYSPGTKIEFYIKEVTKDQRIILSDFETIASETTIEDFKLHNEGTVQSGEIINIKPQLGLFIKFDYQDNKFIGLIHYKEIKNIDDYNCGEKIDCYISKVDIENKKIFLKLVKD